MWYDALKSMKKKSGMTTAEIAEKSGVPEPTLEKLFAGKTRTPTLPTLSKLVHLFGYTLDDLDKPPDLTKTEVSEETKKSPEPETGSGEITREMSIELLKALGLLNQSGNLSDDDLAFLAHIIGLLEWRFGDRA